MIAAGQYETGGRKSSMEGMKQVLILGRMRVKVDFYPASGTSGSGLERLFEAEVERRVRHRISHFQHHGKRSTLCDLKLPRCLGTCD